MRSSKKQKKKIIIGTGISLALLIAIGAGVGVILTQTNNNDNDPLTKIGPSTKYTSPEEKARIEKQKIEEQKIEEQRIEKVFNSKNTNVIIDGHGNDVGIDKAKFKELQSLSIDHPKYDEYYSKTMNIPKKYVRNAISVARRDKDNKPILSKKASGLIHKAGGGNEPTVAWANSWADDVQKGFLEEENKVNPNSALGFVSEIATSESPENRANLTTEGFTYDTIKDENKVKRYMYDKSFATNLWNQKSDGKMEKIRIAISDVWHNPTGGGSSGMIPMGNHITSYFLKGETNITLNIKARFFGNLMVKTSIDGDWEIAISGDGYSIVEFKKQYPILFAVRMIVTPDVMDFSHTPGWGGKVADVPENINKINNGERIIYEIYDLFFEKTVGGETKDIKARKVNSYMLALNRFWLEGTDMRWMVYSGEIDNVINYLTANFEVIGLKGYAVNTFSKGRFILKQAVFISTSYYGISYGFSTADRYAHHVITQLPFAIKKPYTILHTYGTGHEKVFAKIKEEYTPAFWFSEEVNKKYRTNKKDENGEIIPGEFEGEGDYRKNPKFTYFNGYDLHELYHATVDDNIYYLNPYVKWIPTLANWFEKSNPYGLSDSEKRIHNEETPNGSRDRVYYASAQSLTTWMFHDYNNYPIVWSDGGKALQRNLGIPSGDEHFARTHNTLTDNDKLYKKYWELIKAFAGDKWNGAQFDTILKPSYYPAEKISGTQSYRPTTYLFQNMLKNKDATLAKELTKWFKSVAEDESLTTTEKSNLMQFFLPGMSRISQPNFKNIMAIGLTDLSSIDGSDLVDEPDKEVGSLSKLGANARAILEAYTKFGIHDSENTKWGSIKHLRDTQIKAEISELEKIAESERTNKQRDRILDLKYILENNWTKLPDGTEFNNEYLWGFDLWKMNIEDRPEHPWKKFQDKNNPTVSKVLKSYKDPSATSRWEGKYQDVIPDEFKNDQDIIDNYLKYNNAKPRDPFWSIGGTNNIVWRIKRYVSIFHQRSIAKKRTMREYTVLDNGNLYARNAEYLDRTPFSPREGMKIMLSAYLDRDLGIDPEFENISDEEQDRKLWNIYQKILLIGIHTSSTSSAVQEKITPGYDRKDSKWNSASKSGNKYVNKEKETNLDEGSKSLVPEKDRVSKKVSITDNRFAKGGGWERKRPSELVVKFRTRDGREIEERILMGLEISNEEEEFVENKGKENEKRYFINNFDASYTKPIMGVNSIRYDNIKKYALKRRHYVINSNTAKNEKNQYDLTNLYTYDNVGKIYDTWNNADKDGKSSDGNPYTPGYGSWEYSISVEEIIGIGGVRSYKVSIIEDTLIFKYKNTDNTKLTVYNSGTISEVLSIRLLNEKELSKPRIVFYSRGKRYVKLHFSEDLNNPETSNLLFNETVVDVETWGGFSDTFWYSYLTKKRKWRTTSDTMENLPFWY